MKRTPNHRLADCNNLLFQNDSKIDFGNSGDTIEPSIIANERLNRDIPKGRAFMYVAQIAFQISGKLPHEFRGKTSSINEIVNKARTILQNSIINN